MAKGEQLQECNRTACRVVGANWWNPNTRAWYCAECATRVNSYIPDRPTEHRLCLVIANDETGVE